VDIDEQTIAIASVVISLLIGLASVAVSIVSVTVGGAGFIFGVYKHYSTLRVAELTYTVTQLTDYDLASSILASLTAIPFVVELNNVGNKQAENVNVRVATASVIEETKIESGETYKETRDERKMQLHIPVFNPGETIRISGQCTKVAQLEDYVEGVEVTHSEGSGEEL
jgi:hypothetical protein